MKDLRLIIKEFDFIKNHNLQFQNKDIHDLVKTASLIELPPLTRLCKEDDKADSLYFVIQGELVASYTLNK